MQEIHIYSQEGDVLYAPCRFDFDGVLPFCAGLEGDQLGDPGSGIIVSTQDKHLGTLDAHGKLATSGLRKIKWLVELTVMNQECIDLQYVGEAGEYAGEVGAYEENECHCATKNKDEEYSQYFGEEGDWGEVGE